MGGVSVSASEALCAEESLALADAALYKAKALGRNQGVGIVPGDAANGNPGNIDLLSVRDGNPPLTRTIQTTCPSRDSVFAAEFNAATPVDNSSV